MAMESESLKNKLMFNPYMIHHHKQWYRFFTNGFIHADWIHLAFNMYALYILGTGVEIVFSWDEVYGANGPVFYILLYIGGLVMSSLFSYEKHKHNIHYNALGASGAVSAVIFAFIIIRPTATLMFGLPAYLFGLLTLAFEHYLSKRGGTGIAHDAHYWGSIYGIVLTLTLKPSLAIDFIHKIQGTY